MTHGIDTGFLVAAEVAEHADHQVLGSNLSGFETLEIASLSHRRCLQTLCMW
jgi:hypothetical protein